jgi:hypothetical protein
MPLAQAAPSVRAMVWVMSMTIFGKLRCCDALILAIRAGLYA